ncbi:hypothetical protein Bmul_3316 [Burkholderia multivorans ATCC 17616]|nr:hypothetical protein Bmul_3316 [Burkholderia multivorans ATCC 17616]
MPHSRFACGDNKRASQRAARAGTRCRRARRRVFRRIGFLPIFFRRLRRLCAHSSDHFGRPAARRRAVRPRRTSALPQGNPGIFSHFLRNYG